MLLEEPLMVVEVDSPCRFVETEAVRSLVERAQTYLQAGFPVHLRGISGTGKTTLGLHLARLVGRPVVMVHGDEQYTTSHLVGGQNGYHLSKISDNYIRSVRRYEEDLTNKWVDDRLTVACKFGYTLLYDEFNRSRPEANNVLLSVLQEGILTLPVGGNEGAHYIHVHPDFRAVFTSNPEEYAGVHLTQDALRERMVTLDVDHFDRATEIGVMRAHAPELDEATCCWIVDVVRRVRELEEMPVRPTVRSCIKLGRILAHLDATRPRDAETVRKVFADVLASGTSRTGDPTELQTLRAHVNEIVTTLTAGG